MATLEDRLIATGGKPSGFDYMRIVLAICVVLFHEADICYGFSVGLAVKTGWARPFIALILPMFFALSGFLVAGSWERCKSLITFGGLRLLRLVPALAVESFLGIVVLGTIFTTLPLGQYFRDPQTWSYLKNIYGSIHYLLPGVFQHNNDTWVNRQLWVLPFELKAYIVLGAMTLVFASRSRSWLLCLAAAYAAKTLLDFYRHDYGGDTGTVPGPQLVVAFLAGLLLYRYRPQIPYSGALAAVAAAISLGLLSQHWLQPWAAPFVAYVTVYLGLQQPKRTWIVEGDYSYATYLYGYPIQQAVWTALPWARAWWSNFLVAGIFIAGVAVVSWHLVERPCQKPGRRALGAIEGSWLPIRDRIAGHVVGHVRGLCPPGLRSRWFPTPATTEA